LERKKNKTMKLTEQIEKEYGNITSQTVIQNTFNSSVEKIIDAFKIYLDGLVYDHGQYSLRISDAYKAILKSTKGLYSKEDITQFSTGLESFFSHRESYDKPYDKSSTGIFLTELISLHYKKNRWKRFVKRIGSFWKEKKIDEYVLLLQEYGKNIDEFGFQLNGPSIRIIGDIGEFCGREMKKGKITIEGNAMGYCGYHLKGGEIIVTGNTEDHLGSYMEGGTIFVRGNTENDLAESMQGGKIFVYGNAKSRIGCNMDGGEVTIFGNAEDHIGHFMTGGKITIVGSSGFFTGVTMEYGTILVKNNPEVTNDYKNQKAKLLINGIEHSYEIEHPNEKENSHLKGKK